MPEPKLNYFQEYAFSEDELARVETLLADPLLQAYISDKTAKFAKESLEMPLPRQNEIELQMVMDLSFNKGALELASEFIRIKGGD